MNKVRLKTFPGLGNKTFADLLVYFESLDVTSAVADLPYPGATSLLSN